MPSGDAVRLGRFIREAREAMGWSQDELARMLGVDRTTVGKWEAGANEPDLGMLKTLRRLLNLPAERILDGNTRVVKVDCEPEIRLRRLGMTLRGAGLRDHEVEYVLGIIKERQAERKQRKQQHGQG